MKPEDIAKAAHEAKEIEDMRDDLRDIAAIFANVNRVMNMTATKRKRSFVSTMWLTRSLWPETTILQQQFPLSWANDQTILDNLTFLQSYLSGKLAAKLQNAANKEHK